MPTYEYKCQEHGHPYSETRSIQATQQRTTCTAPNCKSHLVRVYTAPPIRFTGSGFNSKKG